MRIFHITLLVLCLNLALANFADSAYKIHRTEDSFGPTTQNLGFNYILSQTVDKSLISLNYASDIYSGYIPVDSQGSYIFYHLYPANGATDSKASINNSYPLILWMQGGPGCSDWLGAMLENGPFTIVNNSQGQQTPELTDINWNQGYNLLYVDQPPGVGFSPVGQNVIVNNSMQSA